jgi:HAD superfamily hydrolase (TIGR01509 family)
MRSADRLLNRGHWVFDLDGTLTLAVHDFAVIRAELGVPATADILGYLATLPPTEAAARHARLHALELALIEQTAAAPGAQALLKRLAKRGTRVGILTRNSRAIALTTLARHGLGAYFTADEVLGRDEALPKPAPDGVQKLAAVWGTPLSDVLMVGDYLFDLQTGRAAGAATIHVDPSRAFRWPELADLAVGSLAELAELLPA